MAQPPRKMMNPNASLFVPSFGVAAPAVTPAPTPAATPAPTPAPAQAPASTPAPKPETPKESWDDDESTGAAASPKPTTKAVTPAPADTASSEADDEGPEVTETVDLPGEEETQAVKAFAELLVDEEDVREHLNVVFIGHVDAGKSTLCGNILALTGQVDDRTIEKYKREAKDKNRESWWLAYVMDINEEEKAKGKTVEVGRASFETSRKRYTILDAPGHKSFVPNMISGASQADVGILVISARKGEFETGFEKGGQTREHATLAKTVGIRQLVVVINKMDDSTVNWSKERYDECVDKLIPFLKSVNYNVKAEVQFLPISGYSGQNIKESVPKSVCSWWTGNTLLGVLDELKPLDRNATAPLRMPIVDKFKDRGSLSIMGKIEFGTVSKGDSILVMPNKDVCEVTEIYDDAKPLKSAKAGENVRLVVKGIEEENVHSGFVVCDTKNPVSCVNEMEVQMAILELPQLKPVFTAGYTAVMHIHTAVEECTITDLLVSIDKKTNKEVKRPRFVKSGAVVRARIQTSKEVCCEDFTKYQALGRFTLRDSGKTIAIGKILSLGPRKRRVRPVA